MIKSHLVHYAYVETLQAMEDDGETVDGSEAATSMQVDQSQ
jgi:hypothetical protein